MKLFLNMQSKVFTSNLFIHFLEQEASENKGEWLDTIEEPYRLDSVGDLDRLVLRFCDSEGITHEFDFISLELDEHIRLSPEDTFVTEDGCMASHEDVIFRVDSSKAPLKIDNWVYDENEILRPDWIFFEDRQSAEEYINDFTDSI